MVQTENNQLGVNIDLSTNMSIGTWYHIVGVYDGENSYLYLNGELKGQTEMSGNVASTSYPLELANQNNNNTTFFDGSIDEISLWNIAHTQEQIQSSMYMELNGNETGLIGYWNFNTGEGENLYDFTGNQNHGTINGALWSTDNYVNDAPTASDIAITTNEDAIVYGAFSGSDMNGDDITYTVTSQPGHGTINHSSGDRTSLSFNGSSSYVFKNDANYFNAD